MEPFITYAHRGAPTLAPENTMASFYEAIRLGAKAIECDVQMSRDGIPVIIHDEFLERTTNGKGMVHQFTLAELKELDAGSWFAPKFSKEKIPTLQELLVWAKGYPMYLNIELKNNIIEHPKLEEKVVDLLSQYHLTERTVISSYNLKSLSRIRQIAPQIQTAYLYFYLNKPWKYAQAVGARSLHAFYPFLHPDTIQQAQKEGIEIIPYTVDDWEDIRRIFRLKLPGVITNQPRRILKYLDYLKTKKIK